MNKIIIFAIVSIMVVSLLAFIISIIVNLTGRNNSGSVTSIVIPITALTLVIQASGVYVLKLFKQCGETCGLKNLIQSTNIRDSQGFILLIIFSIIISFLISCFFKNN